MRRPEVQSGMGEATGMEIGGGFEVLVQSVSEVGTAIDRICTKTAYFNHKAV
jgi:hypothetical protein